ncbi:hypothetical protein O1611_g7014 [Lasiodiplodia mahajangana]|uniref:Uncharacterized protein n=1 Tax=Lasiodiplodia mahajangana TaxID=1108764 RepID=A0ACC2JH01_9PEZI|nr:hypothetical protein O1611_g7014 [Lasiodiplodia mahajangana]
MANTLAALKHLACPAGDNCTAFQCLFSHARDKSESDGKTANNNTTLNNQNKHKAPATPRARPYDNVGVNDIPHEQEVQRKRIKLDSDSTVTSLQHSSTPSSLHGVQPSEQRKHPPVPTIHKGGSPRILRHSPPSTNKKTTSHPTELEESKVVAPTAHVNPRGMVSSGQPTKQSSREPESLNPRLLKKAPASHPTRVALVKALHKEYQRLNDELKKTARGLEKKWLLSSQELIVKTLDEEQEIATKKTSIYNTSIRNKILMYKKMSLSEWKDERSKVVQSTSPNSIKSTSKTAEASIETGLTLPQEVEFLHRLVYNFEPLAAYGYVSVIPSQEDIKTAEAAISACGNTETCDRCTRRFQVFPGRRETDGALSSNGPCVYHPGKPYFPDRVPGDRSKGQRRFRCCQRNYDDEAGGCTTAQHHVFKTTDPKRLASVLNFVNTPINPKVPKDRAVSFDCEMGYTVYGLELIRLTVVSWPAGDMLLDILVQPLGEVLDLNTRYSGVRPEDMASAERCVVGSNYSPTVIPTSDPTEKPKQRLKIAPSPKYYYGHMRVVFPCVTVLNT